MRARTELTLGSILEDSHLCLNEVFAVQVPLRHNRLQQVLLLFELALSLCDLLPPIKYLRLPDFNISHFLLHL